MMDFHKITFTFLCFKLIEITTLVINLELFDSSVVCCFVPLRKHGISIRMPISDKTSALSLKPRSTMKVSPSCNQFRISSALFLIIWLRIPASLFLESDRHGPRTDTLYPDVVTTIMGFISGLCLCRLKERLEKLKLVDFLMYMYVPSNTSNAGMDSARPDANSFCANGLVCLAMTSSREICPKPTKSFIRERLAEEMALRI